MSKSKLPTLQKLLLLDIDEVLFDSNNYQDDVNNAMMLNMGVSKQEFSEANEQYYKNIKYGRNYDPLSYAKFMSDYFHTAYSPLERITTDIDRARRGRYYDTYESVDLLSRIFEIGIYSEGIIDHQQMKLRSMNLSLFLNPNQVHIFTDKRDKTFVRSLPTGTLIADNNLEIIEFLSEFENISPIMVDRRGLYPQYDGLYCTSLEDMYKLLKKKFGGKKG